MGKVARVPTLNWTFFYDNGFLIVDPKEAWVVETVQNEFAAEKVETSHRNISNCLSIGTKIDRMSDGLKQLAQDNGLWNGSDPFDFAKIFKDNTHNDRSRFEAGCKLLDEMIKDSNFDIKSMLKVLRNSTSGICRSLNDKHPTASSQASVLTDSSKRPSVHWFTGTPDPEYSYFKPFIFHPTVKVASEKTKSPNSDSSNNVDAFDKNIDRKHFLWMKHEQFYERLNQKESELHQTLRQIENLCIDELEQILKSDDSFNKDDQIDNLFSDSVESELRFYR